MAEADDRPGTTRLAGQAGVLPAGRGPAARGAAWRPASLRLPRTSERGRTRAPGPLAVIATSFEFRRGITMRTTLRRAVTLMVTAVVLGLGAATVSSAPALAGPECAPGTNWDGVLKVCR